MRLASLKYEPGRRACPSRPFPGSGTYNLDLRLPSQTFELETPLRRVQDPGLSWKGEIGLIGSHAPGTSQSRGQLSLDVDLNEYPDQKLRRTSPCSSGSSRAILRLRDSTRTQLRIRNILLRGARRWKNCSSTACVLLKGPASRRRRSRSGQRGKRNAASIVGG